MEYVAEMAREGILEQHGSHTNPSGDYSEAVMAFALRHHTNTYELNVNRPVLQNDESPLCIFAPNVCGIIVHPHQHHWVTIKEIEGTLWLLDSTQLPVKLTYEAYLAYFTHVHSSREASAAITARSSFKWPVFVNGKHLSAPCRLLLSP